MIKETQKIKKWNDNRTFELPLSRERWESFLVGWAEKKKVWSGYMTMGEYIYKGRDWLWERPVFFVRK